jgi:ABC-type dipeptide/oligopeptide/nickel transport system permease component
MIRYILKRLLRSFVTIFIVVSIVFILLRQMPIEGYFNNFDKATPTQIQVTLDRLGLTKPMPVQLVTFYNQLLHGDLGVSNKYRVNYPITSLIAQKMPISLKVGLLSIALALLTGLPLGMLMAKSATSPSKVKIPDKIGSVFVSLIQAVPQSVYHLFIQIYLTEFLNHFIKVPLLFKEENPVSWILPVLSLSLANMAMYAMWMRRYMVDESNKDYATLARAKGVSSSNITRKHIFPNAIVPLVQYIPTSIMLTLMGSLYVESRYSIPGMGGLLVDSIKRQDNTLVQALVLIYTIFSIAGVLLGDVAMALVDPRIKLSKGESR